MLDGFQQDPNLSVGKVHGGHEEQHREVLERSHGGMGSGARPAPSSPRPILMAGIHH